jgi:hypothetical protein
LKTIRGQLANELLESVLDQAGGDQVEMGSSFEGGGNNSINNGSESIIGNSNCMNLSKSGMKWI